MVPGVLGLLDGLLVLPDDDPDPIEPELEPVLPLELEPVLPLPIEPELLPEPLVPPEPLVLPEVLPYCFTQSSRSVPILPTHWLGTADESVLELPLAPLPVEPEPLELDPVALGLLLELPLAPAPVEPEPLELDPVALGLLLELPVLPLLPELPEVCAHDAVARPSIAAATAAVSVFAFTIDSPKLE